MTYNLPDDDSDLDYLLEQIESLKYGCQKRQKMSEKSLILLKPAKRKASLELSSSKKIKLPEKKRDQKAKFKNRV